MKRTDVAFPLRVAFVVHTFHMGGLERCVARLVNRLDRGLVQPLIICLGKNAAAAEWIEADDVPIVELHKRPGNDPQVIGRFAQLLRDRQVDIVHSHNWGTLVETSLARRLAAVPVHVHAERGMELEDIRLTGLRPWLRGRAMRWALNHADAVVAVADAIRQRLATRCGPLRLPIELIPNGVDRPQPRPDSPAREEIRAAFKLLGHSVLVGSVGRLARVKNFPLAVQAVGQLVEQGADAHLVLVGEGPERSAIGAAAEQLGLAERVHLVGQQTDIGAWYAAMDIFVNVSLNEGMSQSILEAMACGLPQVVTDVGDSRTLVGGSEACGLVVAAGRADEVAAALGRLIADSDFRGELQRNALNRYKTHYRVSRMVAAYEELYARLWPVSLDGGGGSLA